jgi:hypothetical protein
MNPSVFDVPNHSRYFEDYVPGSVFEFGTSPVDGTEIHSQNDLTRRRST